MKKQIKHIYVIVTNKTCNKFKQNDGQSTVEFAIVLAALLTIVIGIGLLWNLSDKGILIEHALSSASHHLKDAAVGIIGDVFSC